MLRKLRLRQKKKKKWFTYKKSVYQKYVAGKFSTQLTSVENFFIKS